MKKTAITLLIAFLILLLLIQAGLTLSSHQQKNQQPAKAVAIIKLDKPITPVLPTHRSYFADKNFYDESYEQAIVQIKKADSKIYGGIIPHHLIVKDKIAAFFEGISQYDYQTIILIGPNHFSRGKSDIILSQAKWQTPYGEIEPNLDLIKNLKQTANIGIEEEPFTAEHSISGLVGFIKKTFPNSQLAPIILKNNTSERESEELAKAIYNNIDPEKTLVLVSVDFSHYQPTAIADFHDCKSNAAIGDFNFDEIYKLEIDSPPSIYTLLKYLEIIKAQNSELIFSTNSGVLINKTDEPTTSHNFFYFKKGGKKEENLINFFFFGDLMLDRNVGEKIKQNGFDYLLTKLAGQENRFFKGIDLISANLEGAVTSDGKHYPPATGNDFAFSPIAVKNLKKYNFNFFNIANNHIADQGKQGILETQKNLTDLDYNYSGCSNGIVEDQCVSKIIEINGKKIGMIGLSAVFKDLDANKITKILSDLNGETLIIVNIHWGAEYAHQFNKKQQDLARNLIDAGADIIIGHHPHVVQGMEIYKNKPIFYSLGNFIFDQYFSVDTQEGLAVAITATANNAGNKYKINLVPLNSKASQVELMLNDKKIKFLEKFAGWSKVEDKYIEQIKLGIIDLSLKNF